MTDYLNQLVPDGDLLCHLSLSFSLCFNSSAFFSFTFYLLDLTLGLSLSLGKFRFLRPEVPLPKVPPSSVVRTHFGYCFRSIKASEHRYLDRQIAWSFASRRVAVVSPVTTRHAGHQFQLINAALMRPRCSSEVLKTLIISILPDPRKTLAAVQNSRLHLRESNLPTNPQGQTTSISRDAFCANGMNRREITLS